MTADWSGIKGLEMEDFAMSVSQAEWDRSKEHLVTSDLAIVRMRKMVLDAISCVQNGGNPPAVGAADMTKITAYDRDLVDTDKWQGFASGNRALEFEMS